MPRIRSIAIAATVLSIAAGCASTGGSSKPSASPVKSATPTNVAAATIAATTATTSSPSPLPSATAGASAGPAAAGPGLIVFASGRDNKNGDQVYVMKPDGSKPILLTKDFGGGWMPALSPDRTRVAFTTSRAADAGAANIYVMNIDGSGLSRVSTGDCCALRASWAPDGKRILYEAPGGKLTVIGADGSGRTDVSAGLMAAWSPDGTRIAFCNDADGKIDVEHVDGTSPSTLAKGPGKDCLPAWSPDGKLIAFSSDRDGKSGIFVMNTDGSGVKRLTTTSGADDWPAWSPDGTMIAFQRATAPDAPADIWVMHADGTHLMNLTNSPTIPDWGPSWS